MARRDAGWKVAFRIGVALALYAGLVVGVYHLVQAWWGIAIGLLLPFAGGLGYAVVTHYGSVYRGGNRTEIGKLTLALDGAERTVRYGWSGPDPLFPAIALVRLEDRIAYYDRLPTQAALVERACELAAARLAGATVTPRWQVTAGQGGADACELASTRGGLSWSTWGSIGGSRPSPEEDLEACLALLHHGMEYPNGAELARAVTTLTEGIGESRARRVKRCQRALAPLVAS